MLFRAPILFSGLKGIAPFMATAPSFVANGDGTMSLTLGAWDGRPKPTVGHSVKNGAATITTTLTGNVAKFTLPAAGQKADMEVWAGHPGNTKAVTWTGSYTVPAAGGTPAMTVLDSQSAASANSVSLTMTKGAPVAGRRLFLAVTHNCSIDNQIPTVGGVALTDAERLYELRWQDTGTGHWSQTRLYRLNASHDVAGTTVAVAASAGSQIQNFRAVLLDGRELANATLIEGAVDIRASNSSAGNNLTITRDVPANALALAVGFNFDSVTAPTDGFFSRSTGPTTGVGIGFWPSAATGVNFSVTRATSSVWKTFALFRLQP